MGGIGGDICKHSACVAERPFCRGVWETVGEGVGEDVGVLRSDGVQRVWVREEAGDS